MWNSSPSDDASIQPFASFRKWHLKQIVYSYDLLFFCFHAHLVCDYMVKSAWIIQKQQIQIQYSMQQVSYVWETWNRVGTVSGCLVLRSNSPQQQKRVQKRKMKMYIIKTTLDDKNIFEEKMFTLY